MALHLKAIVRIMAYFAEDDINPLVNEICRTYAAIINRSHIKYHVSFYALFDQDYTDAHESHRTLNLNDIHINLGQKQLTAPNCLNNKFTT